MIPPPPTTRCGDDADVHLRADGTEVSVADPYRWLEDGDSAEVAEWVAQHNRRTREALDARPTRERWLERLSALVALPTVLSLEVVGDRLFVLERAEGADQFALVVRSASDAAVAPRVLVDPAGMAHDAAVAIDWFHPSPDGSLVAYGLSEGGTENSVLHVLRVDDGVVLPLRIADTRAASVAWRPDVSGFWYTTYPPGDEYHRHVRYHSLQASDAASDAVVFDRLPTAESWPDVSVSRDGRWVLVHLMVGWGRVDVHLLDTVNDTWAVVCEGVEAQQSFRVHGDTLVGVTTRDAPNGRVVVAPVSSPTDWTTIVAERPDAVLGAMTIVDADVLLVASSVAVDRLERWSLVAASTPIEVIDLGVASVAALDCDDGVAFAAVATFGAPVEVRRISTNGVEHWCPRPPDAALLPRLTVSQVHYPSTDGTLVPMFVAHRADVTPSPSTPLVLTGYGGFAIAESPVWMPNLAAWCAAGGVYAIAGLRGGYEYGEAWHRAGRRERKQQVFDDFHAAADWLVAEGFTDRSTLAVHGGSNGGLLMGAAITQRPDLAAAVWCAVPLLDMVRFPQFLIARLWTDEYGDPDVPGEFEWLHTYSPYHRVVEGTAYPSVLFTTAEGDTRVDPCHARKMTAALVDATSADDERPVLLWQAGRAGHGVGKPASMRVAEGADVLAFFCWQLDVEHLP